MQLPGESEKAKGPPPAVQLPLFIVLVIGGLWLVFRDSEGSDAAEEDMDLLSFPSKIVFSSEAPPAPARRMRGSSGPPVEFHWVFPDGVSSAAGAALRSRLLALDAKGYPAKASACNELKVDVSLHGQARLVNGSAPLVWRGSELELDIQGNVAGRVGVDVRISPRDPSADAILYSSEVQFEPGPATNFSLRLRPVHSGWASRVPLLPSMLREPHDQQQQQQRWVTHVFYEAVVSATDMHGNAVPMSKSADLGSIEWRKWNLRGDSTSFKSTTLMQPDEDGNAHAKFRITKPGEVELWLDHDAGGNETALLRDQTAQRFSFIGPSSSLPQDWTKHDKSALSEKDEKWQETAGEVRDAFLHAWNAYKRYAWGADELKPLSKRGHDTFCNIGITLLDSLTSLWILGLRSEFEEARNWVRDSLDFGKCNREVSVFELIIRALGGLLSAHALSGDQMFLDKAKDLGDRLLPALNSTSGMPWPRWDISRRQGVKSQEASILAEAGSLQLEFRHLTALTGDEKYRRAADACFEAIQSVGFRGLLPVRFTPPGHAPLMPVESNYQLGALADSYYEYLLKQWLQSPGEARFKELWYRVMEELPQLARPQPDPDKNSKKHIRLIEATQSGKPIWKMDHLSCFVPGMIALGVGTVPHEDLSKDRRNETWRQLAHGVTASCVDMWTFTPSGLAPEWVSVASTEPHDIQKASNGGAYSLLRPETAESLFYMHRLTRQDKYRKWGKKLFSAILNTTKLESGFASVHDVYKRAPDTQDEMQSFVLAETFKYLFLLFSPPDALSLDNFVLNTEGHPLPRWVSR